MSNIKTWPEKIWLQVGDGLSKLPDYRECQDISWCADKVVDCEVEYVRADLMKNIKEDLIKEKQQINFLKTSIKRMKS